MSGCSTAAEGTHIVLDVQVTASSEEDVHNLQVAFVGCQVQGAPAILRRSMRRAHSVNPINISISQPAGSSHRDVIAYLFKVITIRTRA